MTVTTLTNRIDYTGDGVVKLFAFNFLVYEDAHLEIYLDGVLTVSGFVITLDIENSGGDVTFTTAPASGVVITILRNVPLSQLIDYTAFGPFPAETHEKGLDLGVMRDQQTVEFNDRALRVPVDDPPVADVPDVAGRAGRLLGFDENGDPVPGSLLSDIVVKLDDLLDVDIVTPATRDTLVYNEATAKFENKLPVIDVGEIRDVTLTTPGDNDTLVLESGVWVNKLPILNMNDLLDVDAGNPFENEILKFIGSQWVNAELPTTLVFAGLFNPTTGVPALQNVVGGGGGGGHVAGSTYIATETDTYDFSTGLPDPGGELVNTNDQVAWSERQTIWVIFAAGANIAAEIDYDNAASGLAAINVQEALDEVEGRVDALDAGVFAGDVSIAGSATLEQVKAIFFSSPLFQDVALWHPSMDEHPEWIDAVKGPRSDFMAATLRGGTDTVLEIWDLLQSPPFKLNTEVITGGLLPRAVDIKGGFVTVAGGANIGISVYAWNREGWQGRTKFLNVSSNPPIPSGNIIGMSMGYSNAPSLNPNTGTPMPSIAYAGGKIGVVRNMTEVFQSAGTFDPRDPVFMNGRIIYDRSTTPDRIYYSNDVDRMTTDVDTDWDDLLGTSSPNQDILQVTLSQAQNNLASRNKLLSSPTSHGLDLYYITSLVSGLNATGLFAQISTVEYSGWMSDFTRGAWLHDAAGTDKGLYFNDLTEAGVVPSQPAATGAQTLSYGPFSAVNYFHRSVVDPDFDFGNLSFSFLCWFKTTGPIASNFLIEYAEPTTRANQNWFMHVSPTVLAISIVGTLTAQVQTPHPVTNDEWHLGVGVWDALRDTARLYLDGALVGETVEAGVGDMTNTAARVFLGGTAVQTNPASETEMALARVVGRVLTDDEIRHMFSTERSMFQDNAIVTLDSVSDDVGVSAIDPVTEDIWLGMSDGLLRWNGLVLLDTRRAADPEDWTDDDILHMAAGGAGGLIFSSPTEGYSEVPARDVRKAVERAIVHPAIQLPDLGDAKAWVVFLASGVIQNSYNVKSVTAAGSGSYSIRMTVPFIRQPVCIAVAEGSSPFTGRPSSVQNDRTSVQSDNAGTPTDRPFHIAWYGQLEGE